MKNSILEKADNLINGDRAAAYGSATENMSRIARGWSEIVGVEIPPRKVLLMMSWLKISRDVHKPSEDNMVDIAGYIGLIDKLEKGE